MPSGVLLRHTRDRLDSLEQLASPTAINGSGPRTPEDCQDLVGLVLDIADSYRKTVASELHRIFRDRSRNVEQLRQARSEVVELADRYVAVVQMVQENPELRNLAGQHADFQSLFDKVAKAITAIQTERTRLINEWPACTPEEMAQAMADNKQGRCPTVEEAFAAMSGVSIDELQRRLEEHKARRKEYGWE
jgi:hypothetical protein